MAKSATKKVRTAKRRVRDLKVKAAAKVKGGLHCATGEHIKEATITVR
jgi:hypothetical protein